MTDRVFFALAALAAAAMTAAALWPARGRLPEGSVSVGDGRYDRVVLDDAQLNRLVSNGARASLSGPPGARALRLEAASGPLPETAAAGPHFRIAADIETQFAGHDVMVVLRVRPAEADAATEIAVMYQSTPERTSGWRRFALGAGSQDVSFVFRAPLADDALGVDYLGVQPLKAGEGPAALVLERVTFERLGRWDGA